MQHQIGNIEPRVAMLSFSTKGSAKSDETEKVADAVKIAKEKAPELTLDGEFQFDAAFVPSVAEKKAPDSEIKGDANVSRFSLHPLLFLFHQILLSLL